MENKNVPEQEKIPAVRINGRMGILREGSSYATPRVAHRPARGKKDPWFKIRCGCCDQSFEIYYGELGDPTGGSLEVAGVNAGIEDWRAIFLPLLGFERRNGEWVDARPRGTTVSNA